MGRDFDEFHTIEFKGSKGWEVFQTHLPEHVGISAVTHMFLSIVVNDREDLQWRLTTAKI